MATPIDPAKGSTSTPAEQTAAGMKTALEDRSKYIRTMAKDMAIAAGTPVVQQAKPVAAPVTKETVDGVTLDKEETPFFEKLHAKSEDRPQEIVEIPSMQEAASIVEEAPVPLMQKTTPYVPSTPPPAPVPDPAIERAAILERLRQKVGEGAQRSIQQSPAPLASLKPPTVTSDVPAPKEWPDIPAPDFATAPTSFEREPIALVDPITPPTPTPVAAPVVTETPVPTTPEQPAAGWSNIPSPTPDFAPFTEPTPPSIPPVSKETYREPIDAYVPPRPLAATPEALHTYSSDFTNRVDSRGATAFSVLAAQQDAGVQQTPQLAVRKETPAKALLAIGTGVLLLILAGGGIFATYQFVTTMQNTPIAALTVPSIVFADEYRQLEGTGSSLLSGLASASNGALVQGNVLVTYILTSTAAEDESIITTPAGGDAFIRALKIPAPDILLRNIAEESSVGVIRSGEETKAFFALRVDSYERTYAGMLTWEPLMTRDLEVLYPLYPAEEISRPDVVIATTTASSTPIATSTPVFSAPVQASARTRFEDTIVANHDVRVLRDTNGRSLILYGYADKRTLLIVRDEAAFEALLARLKAE